MGLEEIISAIQKEADERIATAKSDYAYGERDCKTGIYDKWYRQNRKDDGAAYTAGWQAQRAKVDECSFSIIG